MSELLTRPMCCFDLETTGLSTRADEAVQIASVMLRDGKVWRRSYYTVRPTCPIQTGAMQKHGYSEESLSASPTFAEIAAELYADWSGCVMTGFNCARFDVPIMQRQFAAAGLKWEPIVVDVFLLAKQVLPGLGSYSLKNLTVALGIPPDVRHDAWADVRQTVALLGLLTHHSSFQPMHLQRATRGLPE
jgi:DNA polymerase III epsilon subunit-like protein